jgi:colicin import membrane protein
MAAALAHDALLPRPPGGTAPGALLALLVHAGLVVALTTAIDWRNEAPEIVSAELWASVPQVAAPPPPVENVAPPAPKPVPAPLPAPAPRVEPARPDAEIATERAAQRKAEKLAERRAREAAAAEEERQRAAAEKTRLEAARKAREQEALEAKADEERLLRQREENLRRMMGQAGGAAAGTAAQGAAPSAAYGGRLVALIRPNIVYIGSFPDNAAAEVEVRAAAAGTIIARRLVKSSGHKEWDDAVLRAIDRTPALPRDTDGRVPPTLIITFRPRD